MSNFQISTEMTLEDGLNLIRHRAMEAQNDIFNRGLAMPRQPMVASAAGPQPYRGELPSDLTALTDQQLGTTMGLLSEWNNYAQAQLAEASSNLSQVKTELEFIEAKLRLVYQKDPTEHKKRSNPERDDYVGTDPRYIQAKSDVLYWEKIYVFVRAIANAAEQSFSAVSRRITQRGQEIDRMNRNHGVSGGSNIPAGPIFPGGRRGG
jgi:hypothetical protein